MKDLLKHLATLPKGPVSDPGELEELLVASWDEFDGGRAEGMSSDKLLGRMEDVHWDPPVLTFSIERDGGTVLGSTRGEIHHWAVDMGEKTAKCSKAGHRQVRPTEPRLDVGPLAEEIRRLIIDRREDPRLKWRRDGSVSVRTGEILPYGHYAKETVDGRRRRFRNKLAELLAEAGWKEVRANVYSPPEPHAQHVPTQKLFGLPGELYINLPARADVTRLPAMLRGRGPRECGERARQ